MGDVNRQVVLIERPSGMVEESNFELRVGPMPTVKPGTFLVRNLYLSMDPAQRAFFNESGAYGGSVGIGEAVWGPAVGQVVDSLCEGYEPGDLVEGWFGWQDYAVSNGRSAGAFGKLPKNVSPTDALGVLGLTALTGYCGLKGIGHPQPGDIVAVSGAAGATGLVAAQTARLSGATVIGIAGGPDKCRWLREKARLHFTIDYKNEDVAERLFELAPGGINVFFDNVGGDILDAVLGNLAERARVIICGGISSGYMADADLPPGPRNIVKICIKRARIEGFVVTDFQAQFPEALDQLQRWVAEGELAYNVDILEGLEHAPAGLRRLFEGKNLGKQLVKIADAPGEGVA
jgi:NADPH-dependent curcumin reductase CurA